MKKENEGDPGLITFRSREGGNGPTLELELEGQSQPDTQAPYVSATGLADLTPPENDYSNGQGTLSVDVYALDEGSGVERVSIHREATELASANANCSPSCPQELPTSLSFDVSSFPEGNATLEARAVDAADNVGTSEPWTLRVDRTAPTEVTNLRVARYDAASTTAAIAWDPGSDPQLADGSPGTGVASYEYRTRTGTGDWSEPEVTGVPELSLVASLGEVVDVEVRSIDAAENVSSGTTSTLTVFQASEPEPWYLTPSGDYVALTPEQEQLAVETAQNDPRISALLGSRPVTAESVVPWSIDGSQSTIVGADLRLVWDDPVDLEQDWPVLEWDESNTNYEIETFHYRMTGATQLTVQVTYDPLEVTSFEPYGGEMEEGTPQPFARSLAPAIIVPQPPPPPRESCGHEGDLNPNVYLITRARVPRVGPDQMWSWDFCERNFTLTQPAVAEKSDWPIAFVFENDSSVQRAKQYYAGRKWASGMWTYVADREPNVQGHIAASIPWDHDEGAYRGHAILGDKIHYRVYGGNPQYGGDDKMYNLSWGFYVVATAHIDHNERFVGSNVGRTNLAVKEITEDIITYNAQFNTRDTIDPNIIQLSNSAKGRQGERILDNDGRATLVCQADNQGNGCIEEF